MANIKKIRRVSTGIFDHGPAADQVPGEVSSIKLQASSLKPRQILAASFKPQAEDTSDTSSKPQAPSGKHQASSRKQQAS